MSHQMLFKVTSRKGTTVCVLGRYTCDDMRAFLKRMRSKGHTVVRCAYPT